jgi:hypothetical protein
VKPILRKAIGEERRFGSGKWMNQTEIAFGVGMLVLGLVFALLGYLQADEGVVFSAILLAGLGIGLVAHGFASGRFDEGQKSPAGINYSPPGQALYCQYCGQILSNQAVRCMSCGRPVIREEKK